MGLPQVTWMDLQQTTDWWSTLRDLLAAPWLQNLILAITAVIGLWTLSSTSRQERRRATVDALLTTLDDPTVQEARSKVRSLVNAGLNTQHLLSEDGLADRLAILSILNRYEFMASGLREGAFDANLYQRMYSSNILSDWNDLEAFVIAYRVNRGRLTAFQEVEQLIIKWKKHPLKAYFKPKPPASVSPVVPAPVKADADAAPEAKVVAPPVAKPNDTKDA